MVFCFHKSDGMNGMERDNAMGGWCVHAGGQSAKGVIMQVWRVGNIITGKASDLRCLDRDNQMYNLDWLWIGWAASRG